MEVVRAALARRDALEPTLRAFRTRFSGQALADAAEIDRAVSTGERLPLAGVPIGVKAWEPLTSFQVRRLRRAGCVVIGLTSVPGRTTDWQTWGHTDAGPTTNPWRPDRTPGGSSAGSAAAVAARVVPLATATDGAGSTRIPAAWCGVLGLKPTTGRLPSRDRTGLAVPGAITRTPRDATLHLSLLLDDQLSHSPDTPTATWSNDLGFAHVLPEQARIARSAADRLASARHIIWTDLPVHLADPEPAWRTLRTAPSSTPHPIRTLNDTRLHTLFRETDVLLTPTTPAPPHAHTGPGTTMNVALTWAFNLSGHPALTIPAGLSPDGTPVGIQAIGRPHTEALLLHLASALETLTPWP
ncbi:MAG TPA: amidase family protein, partial [Thermomonospora sp.]|nr:amidase family protein [Thermomonospora sp.]